MSVAAPADGAAAWLYPGKVMHARLRPVGHRFVYRVMSLLIDLDRLDEAGRTTWLFGVNRAALYGFHERDHGLRDGTALRPWLDRLLADSGVARPDRVLLLCYPRVLGYVFDPLSVYYCFDASGGIAALVYEVRNTFGESHPYVVPVAAGERAAPVLRHHRDKAFHVSPFVPMAARYRFATARPGQRLTLRILESDAEGPLLAAAFSGRRRPLAAGQLALAAFRLPLMTLKIVLAIHFEALRLWLKGVRLHSHPGPALPVPASAASGDGVRADDAGRR